MNKNDIVHHVLHEHMLKVDDSEETLQALDRALHAIGKNLLVIEHRRDHVENQDRLDHVHEDGDVLDVPDVPGTVRSGGDTVEVS